MSRKRLTEDDLRAVRAVYDSQALSPGDRAALKRCRDAEEIVMEGAYWRVVTPVPAESRGRRLAIVVACFPAAPQLSPKKRAGFRTGTFLRRGLAPGQQKKTLEPAKAIPFRQLIAAGEGDDDELCHRLRRLLTRIGAPVDWGVLGLDIVDWNDRVRRQWVQEFYAPTAQENTHV